MEEIKRIIQELEAKETDWREYYLKNENYLNESVFDETKELLEELVDVIRRREQVFIDEGETEQEEGWWKEITALVGEEAAHGMKKRLGSTLSVYREIKPLRDLKEGMIPLMGDMIENIVGFYNPAFFRRHEQYGIEDINSFAQMVTTFDSVISAHVKRSFSKEAARKEFEIVTGIGEPYSRVYEQLYEQSYDRIQRNLLMEEIKMIGREVELLLSSLEK